MEIKKVPVVYSVAYDGIMDEFAYLNAEYKSLAENPNQSNQWLMCSSLESSVAIIAGRLLRFIDYNAANRRLQRTAVLSESQIDLIQSINTKHKMSIYHPSLYAGCSRHEMSALYSLLAGEIIDLFRIALAVRESVDRLGGPFPEECGTKSRIFLNRLVRVITRKPLMMPKWREDIYFVTIDNPGHIPDMACLEGFIVR